MRVGNGKFDTTISFGNMLTMVVLIVGFIGTWVSLKDRVSNLESEIAVQKELNKQHDLTDDRSSLADEEFKLKFALLEQRLIDWPLHRHSGTEIIYSPDPALRVRVRTNKNSKEE